MRILDQEVEGRMPRLQRSAREREGESSSFVRLVALISKVQVNISRFAYRRENESLRYVRIRGIPISSIIVPHHRDADIYIHEARGRVM